MKFGVIIMKFRLTALIVVLITISMVIPRTATACWIKLSPEDLIEKSDVILIGDIIGRADEDESKWVTYWNVKVYYYLKGEQKSGESTVGTPGVKNKSKIVSTDYRLDQWGNTVLLFLRKKDDYYEPITPQGVVNLTKNEYNRKPGEPLNGQVVLKEFDIADKKIASEERSELEKFILNNKLLVVPGADPQAQPSCQKGFSMEKSLVLILIITALAAAGLKLARRSKKG